MERNKLISLALSFAAFIVPKVKIERIILFGSVAADTFDKESDIDLFIETDKKNKTKIKNLLDIYKKTKEYEKFKIEGIENEISTKIGKLEEWNALKRSIISNGIVLYGKYQDSPSDLIHKILFVISANKTERTKKVRLWRKIYGYKQKINNKVYHSSGLIERRAGRGAFISSLEKAEDIKDVLRKHKIKYSIFDIWVENK